MNLRVPQQMEIALSSSVTIGFLGPWPMDVFRQIQSRWKNVSGQNCRQFTARKPYAFHECSFHESVKV
jgi:hypothetical protein